VVGRRVIPWVLHYIAHTGSRELFRLAVLALALGVAFGSAKLFGVSLALGAFFAGMVLAESELSHAAAQETLPLRDAFAVLFFVSVGMLFDPTSLWRDPLPMLAAVFIIVIGKSVAAFVIVRIFGHPVTTALLISASLAQIGEFSFILAELGVKLGLLPEAGRDLILGSAILSILLNPVVFNVFGRLRPLLERVAPVPVPAGGPAIPAEETASAEPAPAATPAPEPATLDEPALPTALTDHVVLVGYGRVGSLIGASLQAAGRPFVVIEDADQPLARLREAGIETIIGNAAVPEVLGLANLPAARQLAVAVPNAFEAGQIVAQARAANPGIAIIARAHSDAEVEHLRSLGADAVIMGEREIARGMAEALVAGEGDQPGVPQPA
jgi:monovalent cation:H+ antiporter-2, CPA2 family